MGVKINAQSDPTSSPFLASMTSLLNIVCARIFHLWLQPDWLFKLFPQFNEHEKCIKTLHDFTDEVCLFNVSNGFQLNCFPYKTSLDLQRQRLQSFKYTYICDNIFFSTKRYECISYYRLLKRKEWNSRRIKQVKRKWTTI